MAAAAVISASVLYPQTRVQNRITGPIENSGWSVLGGHLRPAIETASDLGQLPPSARLARVTMFFSKTPQQQAELDQLLAQQQDPASPNYHRWLTPEEFGERFGLSQNDIDRVRQWLQSQGLQVDEVARSRTWISFSGTAQQVGAALRTDFHRYDVRGQTHFSASREPSVPGALAPVVLGFRGLNDFRMKPLAHKASVRFTSEISGNHFLAPGDLAAIYNINPLYGSGFDGRGWAIAVAGQSNIDISDVRTFRNLSGLAANDPLIVLVPQSYSGDPDPGMVAGDIDEANLDVQWAGAVARGATIKYVYSQNVLDAFSYIVDQNLAPILSISYGSCEGGASGFTQSDANILASIAQRANAQGITIVAPSGDSGAADCDNNSAVAEQGLSVDLPGALPYVTAVGGTRFSGDSANPSAFWAPATSNPNTALFYIPETAWNDSTSSDLAATGGGSSRYFPKPSWQTGTGVPNDGARDVPDIALQSSGNHDGYLVCSRDVATNTPTCMNGFRKANGDLTVFGGTSAAVPAFAGIVALINQVSNSAQGNINPHLYAMAAASPGSFHDVTTGDNKVPFKASGLADCTTVNPVAIGYSAAAGFDLATGWGSIDAQSFVNNWTTVAAPAAGASTPASFSLSASPSSLTVKRGSCGTAQIVLPRTSGFVGTPSFTCTSAAPLTSVTCSVSPVANNSLLVPGDARREPLLPMVAVCLSCLALLASRTLWQSGGSVRKLAWLCAFALSCILAGAVGCSGGGDQFSGSSGGFSSSYVLTIDAPASMAPGTGALTVTGMIGGVTSSAGLTLTVN